MDGNVVEAIKQQLIRPERVWSRAEVASRPCPVPKIPGVYAWYFREIPGEIPIAGCNTFEDLTLLYVGISRAFPTSKRTLRTRIKTHYRPRGRSTLRRSLGCLLEERLDLKIAAQPGGKSFYYGDTEEILSDWMGQNAFVVWSEHPQPWEVESSLIKTVSLPLNINHNKTHAHCASLQALRADARTRVKLLS